MVSRVSAAKGAYQPLRKVSAHRARMWRITPLAEVGCYQDFALAEREKLWGNDLRVRGCVLPRFLAFYFLRVGQRLATAKETA